MQDVDIHCDIGDGSGRLDIHATPTVVAITLRDDKGRSVQVQMHASDPRFRAQLAQLSPGLQALAAHVAALAAPS